MIRMLDFHDGRAGSEGFAAEVHHDGGEGKERARNDGGLSRAEARADDSSGSTRARRLIPQVIFAPDRPRDDCARGKNATDRREERRLPCDNGHAFGPNRER